MSEPPNGPTDPQWPAGPAQGQGQYGPGQYPQQQPGQYPQEQYSQGQYGRYPQEQYGQGQYPQQGQQYPAQQYPGAGQPGAGYPPVDYPSGPGQLGPAIAARIRARSVRRPAPRFAVALAAAGVVLVVVGVVIWASNYLAGGFHLRFDPRTGTPKASGDGRRFFGAGLSLVVVLVGYTLMVTRKRGPLASAGAIAGALGVPLTIGFATLDLAGSFRGQQPINLDAVLLVSVVVFLVTYLAVPGAQGRAFFLTLAALFLASWAQYKAAPTSLFASAVRLGSGGNSISGRDIDTSTTAVAAVGLIFGIGYYALAFGLDRKGRPGAAVAFVIAGFASTVSGAVAAAPDFDQIGEGLLLIVLGSALGWYGARFGRRFTAWVWAAAVAAGVGLLVVKAFPDNATAAGVAFVVVGAVIVVGAQLVAGATHERDDLDEEATPAVASR